MGTPPLLNLGAWRQLDGTGGGFPLLLPAKQLVTHGVVVGMTGSGKTGLLMVMIEEALRNKVPTLVIDVKGDLPNLLLAFPSFDPAPLEPWVEPTDEGSGPEARAAHARTLAEERRAALNPGAWLTPRDGRTPAVVVSVAHLDDEERALVLGLLLEETLSWVRSLRGSSRLRALIVFDEVYGFLPPHPTNPPTKRPLVSLMKQARAFGVGVVVATQNPMDLDYRALSNAGLWSLGRLQTDADRERVIDGISHSESGANAASLDATLKRLGPRWFVVQNTHASVGPILLKPRHAISLMRGPMTRGEIRAGVEYRRGADVGGGSG